MEIDVKTTKILVDYLKEKGHKVSYDENPSEEKIARIKKIVELKKKKEVSIRNNWK
jgi:hypothetical protein